MVSFCISDLRYILSVPTQPQFINSSKVGVNVRNTDAFSNHSNKNFYLLIRRLLK